LELQAHGLAWHTLSVERVLRAEKVDARRGLSSAEAASRAGRFGPNELAAGRAEPRWLAFIRYSGPMQIVLLGGRAVNGNPAAWIILLAVACAVVIAVPTGLWVSWRRERSRDYNPAHRATRQPPSSGPGRRDRPGCPSADHPHSR
jgi:magnesium-transporting ATPase (P-type)